MKMKWFYLAVVVVACLVSVDEVHSLGCETREETLDGVPVKYRVCGENCPVFSSENELCTPHHYEEDGKEYFKVNEGAGERVCQCPQNYICTRRIIELQEKFVCHPEAAAVYEDRMALDD
ncbi:uncharacterized protein LOC141909810 [Tubulanus polymorphus]|uniref:uncharacterized protein LOC141909810 n=1 Tax=Tubulanus polymorphus TaxID=672921 RepID=UPI003DA6CD6A